MKVTFSHGAGACRRTTGMRGVEIFEAQAIRCHRVTVLRLNGLQSILADVTPTLIIGHG